MRLLLLSLFMTLLSCAGAPKPTVDESARESMGSLEIIDAHIHTRFSGQLDDASGLPVTQEELLREMKKNNVVGAIAHTGQDGAGYYELSKYGVFHCAGTGPRVDVKRIESGLKAGRYRCIKIYLGYVPQYAFDKNYEPAYKLAEKYDVPVVFHTGDTYGQHALKYSDPMTVDEVALRHPKVNFVIAHCGNPWIESAAEIAYNKKNVYLDGSAFLIGNLSKTSQEKIDEYVVRPLRWIFGYLEDPTKLMFGTDWPLVEMKPVIEAFKRAIPREHWKAVFHDNAARVFKIPPRAPGERAR